MLDNTPVARGLPQLIDAFERCTLPREEWTHAAHLRVALWYLVHYPYEVALDRLRHGIGRYNRAVSSRGYHETLTCFWAQAVRRYLDEIEPCQALEGRADRLVAKFSDARLPWTYYSAGRLASDEARTGWTEPDLRSFSGPE